jgi:hypothetical protein
MPLVPTLAGIRVYRHEQTTASNTWLIYHSLGSKPLVEILVHDNGVLKKAWPLSMEHIDENNLRIVWSSPRTGFATTLSNTLV